MNKLVMMHDRQAVTSSLQVAETFGKQHYHVMEAIQDLLSSPENSGVLENAFAVGTYIAGNGKTNPMYYMNHDGFTLLAMGFTGAKALQFKLKYISAFNAMERQIALGVPQTLPEALRLAADQAEQIEQQKQTIAIQAPKALFADAVATSQTTILIGDLAKVLKQGGVDIGAGRLFNWLRSKGYLIRRNGTDHNMPTQKSMNLGLFEVKETAVSHSDGHVTVNKTPKVTGKGQQYFINLFLKEGVNQHEQ
jgi:anti-repressor protein